jgi:general stress protein CsbA
MKPDRSRNDWIALALVAVLAFLLALIAAATLSGHPLGEEAWVTAAAIVGAVAGYLTAGRSHQTPAPAEQISTGEEPQVLDQTPPAPAADEHLPGSGAPSATEAHGGEQWDDVTNEFLK